MASQLADKYIDRLAGKLHPDRKTGKTVKAGEPSGQLEGLHADGGLSILDLSARNDWPAPCSGTLPAGCVPVGGRADVRRPERPRAALAGTNLVDLAAAFDSFVENAVAAGQLDETPPPAHAAKEGLLERCYLQVNCFGQFLDFRLVDPDVARITRAAAPAAGAAEP